MYKKQTFEVRVVVTMGGPDRYDVWSLYLVAIFGRQLLSRSDVRRVELCCDLRVVQASTGKQNLSEVNFSPPTV